MSTRALPRASARAVCAASALVALLLAPLAAAGDGLAPAGPCADEAGAHGSVARLFSPQDVAADAPPPGGGGPAPAPFDGRDACDGAGGCGGQNELPGAAGRRAREPARPGRPPGGPAAPGDDA
ncbi:MAG: hypothetical protein R3E88_15045 [Myxococcota bacterium]